MGLGTFSNYMPSLTKAMAELRKSEIRFRAVFENSLDAIGVSLNGVHVFVNPAYCSMFGYAGNDELTGKSILDLIAEEERERIMDYARNRTEGRPVPSAYETRGLRKNGTAFDMDVHVSSYTLEGEKYTLAILRDISGLKRTENELCHAKNYTETIIRTAGVIIVGLDNAGNITVFNRTAEKITGYAYEELKGKNWFEVLVPRNRYPQVWEEFVKLTTHGFPEVFENPVLTKTGEERLITWRNSMILEDGKVVGSISFGIDITEHRKLEEQLRQSQKMESVGLLAGGVAHDFNNMLQAIIGYGDLLKKKMEHDQTASGYISEILKVSARAAELTRSLLAYSRKQTLISRPELLNEIIRDTSIMLTRLMGEDIELTTALSDIDPVVSIDANQIRQVLINLANNARDAMPSGGKLMISTAITKIDEQFIKMHGYGEERKYALLTVSDTGSGMDENTRKNIFEPFFTTKEVGKGTGLGLAMVYGTIKQHDGYINCYSEVGKGTTFKIYIPLIKSGKKENENTDPHEIQGGTETILLAEDEESVRKVTAILLEDAGYTLIEAVDGEDAVEKFRLNKDKIDLLLLDAIMPKKNGKEAYDEILKISPGVKACFISGYAKDIIISRTMLDEACQFIPKPIAPDELFRKIRELLDN